MTNCNTPNCIACAFILEAKEVNGASWKINKQNNCNNYNLFYGIVYMKEKCKKVYIGERKCQLKFRLSDHCGCILNKLAKMATGHHFNLPGHFLADLSVIIIEQVKKNDTLYKKRTRTISYWTI